MGEGMSRPPVLPTSTALCSTSDLPGFFFSALGCTSFRLFLLPQASALALRVEHLVWGMQEMSAGLSMAQLDTLKNVLLEQVARVDEAKVRASDGVLGVKTLPLNATLSIIIPK